MAKQSKKALLWSAFFVAVTSLLLTQAALANCPNLPITGLGRIKHVFDGDTVELQDGRRVRLLGINTPEFDHKVGDSEPYAVAARQRLRALVPRGTKVSLQTDKLKKDRYGRLLAHLRREDGSNPALPLLREGLATTLILPPNVAAARCFSAAEAEARTRALGIWGESNYQPKPTARLATTGYQLISAQISGISASKKFHYLNTSGGLTLRISKQEWREYFTKAFPPHWPGINTPNQLVAKRLTVRGWVSRGHPDRNRGWQLRLYHPAGLELNP